MSFTDELFKFALLLLTTCPAVTRLQNTRSLAASGVASPKIWGGQKLGRAKMFDFRRITLFCLEKRLLKHKMTIFSKNLGGGMTPLALPGYAYANSIGCHHPEPISCKITESWKF